MAQIFFHHSARTARQPLVVMGRQMESMKNWELLFEKKIASIATKDDPADDVLHFTRVVAFTKMICSEENGRPEVVVPVTWLHDF